MKSLPKLPVRRIILFANCGLGCAMLLAAGIAPVVHKLTVTAPARRYFETAVDEVVARERAARARQGQFVAFSSEAENLGQDLPGIDKKALHTDAFAFRGVVMPDGRLTVTAWTRPEAVRGAGIPPLAAVYEFSPDGKALRKEKASDSE